MAVSTGCFSKKATVMGFINYTTSFWPVLQLNGLAEHHRRIEFNNQLFIKKATMEISSRRSTINR
jgi:hypothetical protein